MIKYVNLLFAHVSTFVVRRLALVLCVSNQVPNHVQTLVFGLLSDERFLHLSLEIVAMEARSSCEAEDPIHVREFLTNRSTAGTKAIRSDMKRNV